MADFADISADLSQEMLDRDLHNQLRKTVVKLVPTGECYNPLCLDELPHSGLFCNAKCASEYEKYKV